MSNCSVGERERRDDERGDLATTTSGTVMNKEPRARRSMSKCNVGERERRDDEEGCPGDNYLGGHHEQGVTGKEVDGEM
jgi:hypothetical protein